MLNLEKLIRSILIGSPKSILQNSTDHEHPHERNQRDKQIEFNELRSTA